MAAKHGMFSLKNWALMVVGTLILSFATAVFILPFELVLGGISGISLLVTAVVGEGVLSIDGWVTIITWSLFILGALTLGKPFAIKTLLSAILYPIGVSLFSPLVDPAVMGGIFCLQQSQYAEIALLLAALFGGALVGTGCALTFLGGGSTGGVDILAFLLCKIFKKCRSSVAIFCIDATIIVLGVFVFGDLVLSLLGICAAFLSALVVDKVFLGESRAFVAQIITDEDEEINRLVQEQIHRTTSAIDVVGGYTKTPKKMLMVSFTMNQYNDLIGIVHRVDPKAFVTVHRAHEINGEGFTR